MTPSPDGLAAALAAWLNLPIALPAGPPTSIGELIAFGTGLACVWLAARRHVANFPIGNVSAAVMGFLFWQSRLFADAGLQIFFIVLGFRGWWQWHQGAVRGEDAPRHLVGRALAGPIVLIGLVTAGLVPLLTWAKGSVPVVDAAVTAASIVAQILLNRRIVQSWPVWVAVDVVSIPLYAYKELWLVAALYVVFLGLALGGWRAWHRAASAGARSSPTPSPDLGVSGA